MWGRRRREWFEKWEADSRRLAEADRERHEDWLVEWRERVAKEDREQKRRFDEIDAAMENDKRVTREIVLEMRAARERDKDLHEMARATIDGLMRVLDRLDGKDGPEPQDA